MEERIGEVAGYVWDYLEAEGPASVSGIARTIEASQTKVYMAIGWLAQEEKIEFLDVERGTKVALA